MNLLFTAALLTLGLVAPALSDPVQDLFSGSRKECRGCDLHDANFKKADLSGVDFTGADLEGASFHRAILKGAIFDAIKGDGANFNLSDLAGASFRGAAVNAVLFFGVLLSRSLLVFAVLFLF